MSSHPTAHPSPNPSPQGGGGPAAHAVAEPAWRAEPAPAWPAIAAFIGRLIFAAVFIMAVSFKFLGMGDTAAYIAAAGFPAPLFLAWSAAIFEVALILGFLTGAFFAETALLAGAYVIFLAFAFHGPSHWEGETGQFEFGFFVDHFTFLAGLLFAAACGPGKWGSARGVIRRA